jgi:hypothetical protein
MTSMRPTRATVNRPRAARLVRRAVRLIRGATRLAWLLAVSAAVVAPASVLGDTGPAPTGVPITEPGTNPLGRVLEVVLPLAVIVVVLGMLIGLAFIVARIGGPVVPSTSATGSTERKRSRSAVGTTLSVLVVAGACMVGVLAGRAIAYQGSLGGFSAIGAAVLALFVIAAVVGLALIGLIATKFRHGQVSPAIGTLLAAAGLLGVGALGGSATAAAFGGLYHEPVVLAAAGQTQVELQAGAILFVARDGGLAYCSSEPDSQAVAGITALDLGELGAGTLRATIGLPAQAADSATVELFIDGGDLPEGSPQLSWSGPARVTDLGADGASGKLTFMNFQLANPAAKPDPGSSVTTSAAPGWPATISGSLSWTCQPWATPSQSPVVPPPSVAP